MQKENANQVNNDEQSLLLDEYHKKFWQKVVFDIIDLALKINQNPLISRQEALTIIPRSSLDKGVKIGKLTKIRHGLRVYFDRLQFHKYILLK